MSPDSAVRRAAAALLVLRVGRLRPRGAQLLTVDRHIVAEGVVGLARAVGRAAVAAAEEGRAGGRHRAGRTVTGGRGRGLPLRVARETRLQFRNVPRNSPTGFGPLNFIRYSRHFFSVTSPCSASISVAFSRLLTYLSSAITALRFGSLSLIPWRNGCR